MTARIVDHLLLFWERGVNVVAGIPGSAKLPSCQSRRWDSSRTNPHCSSLGSW